MIEESEKVKRLRVFEKNKKFSFEIFEVKKFSKSIFSVPFTLNLFSGAEPPGPVRFLISSAVGSSRYPLKVPSI